jgi:3-hydroxybutyryl-CoA dehydrogenase
MAPPRTVFATPTINLSIADLASCTYRPGQCIGVAVNAAQLSDEAESIAEVQIPIRITSQTTPEAQALVREFWQRLGYTPVVELDTAEAMLR